jgi:hypothetical protein
MTLDPARVAEVEQLARFLSEGHHFSKSTLTVKYQAFSPPKNLRFSVFRISSDPPPGLIPEEDIWSIARDLVERTRGPVLGRADLSASNIAPEGLRLEPAPMPHPRHANIVGWPEEREKQKAIKKALAAKATLVLRPPT